MSLLPEINQASAEINKLVAQANIHQSIAPVDPASFTDPADTALLASRDPVIREVSVGMTGDAYSEYSVSGTPPLSLLNSLGKPLKAWSVDVLPYQEGTGDPSPDNVRTIHGTDKLTITTAGKNLLQILPTESTVSNGVTFTVNADGTISTQGTASGTAVFRHYITASDLPDGEDLALNGVPSGGGWMTIYGLAFCNANGAVIGSADSGSGTTISASSLSDLAQVQIVVRNGINVNGKLFTPMIRLASITDSSFTPYLDPSQTVITLHQTVYTGTIGSEGGESRTVAVDMGLQNWIYHAVRNVFYYVTPDGKPTGTGRSGYGMCEAYKVMEGTQYANLTDGQLAVGTNFSSTQTASVVVKDSRFTDAAQFKAAVAGVKLVYEIADPTSITLSTPTIPTPKGTATTWATAEDGTVDGMKVTYIKSE